MLRLLKFDVFSHSMWLSVFSRLCPNIKNQKHVVGFPKRVCLCDLWCIFFLSGLSCQIHFTNQDKVSGMCCHGCLSYLRLEEKIILIFVSRVYSKQFETIFINCIGVTHGLLSHSVYPNLYCCCCCLFKQVYKIAHLPLLAQKCIHAYLFVHF